MAAMSADSRIKIPADPACPPVGVTYTITGTDELEIFSMISRVELTIPPGVFISINTALQWRRAASSIARSMYSRLIG
jgi:hypothetical protein